MTHLFCHTGDENEARPEPASAEISVEGRLQIMRNRSWVAALSAMSQRFLQQSTREHVLTIQKMGQMMEAEALERQRDRTFFKESFSKYCGIMRSSVSVMADMRDILRDLVSAERAQSTPKVAEGGQSRNSLASHAQGARRPHSSVDKNQPITSMAALAEGTQGLDIVSDDNQSGTACVPPSLEAPHEPYLENSQQLLPSSRPLDTMPSLSGTGGWPRTRRRRGQKRARYSP